MIDLERLIQCENESPATYAEVIRRPYGVLFYNLQNPESHDSNHAVIDDPEPRPGEVIDEITSFYEQRGLVPRIYRSFREGQLQRLRPFLEERDYEIIEWEDRYLVLKNPAPVCDDGKLVFGRVHALDSGFIDVILSEDAGDWNVKALERSVARPDVHLLAGKAEGRTVTIASLWVADGLSVVENVITHRDHRGRGYAREFMRRLVRYYRDVSSQPLYLCSSNPTAIRIYEEIGFADIGFPVPSWAAHRRESAAVAKG